MQTLIAAGARRPGVQTKHRRSEHAYALSGLLYCGLCQRRMIGSFNNGRNHYRCTYTAYSQANHIAHPRSLYIREDRILDLIDPWIARAFAPSNLHATVQAMADAQHDPADQTRLHAARETLAACQTKLERYRAALEAGTDPVVVQQWIGQVQAERAVAEAEVRKLTGRKFMTADEIARVAASLGGIAAVLADAEPSDRAEVYEQLGLRLIYEPGPRLIKAEAIPNGSCTKVCPRGELNPKYMIVLRTRTRPADGLGAAEDSGHAQPAPGRAVQRW